MAEPTESELEQLAKKLADAHERTGAFTNALDSLKKRIDDNGKVISSSTDTYDELNRASKEYKNKVSELTNQVKSGRTTQAEATDSLKILKSQFDATLDSMKSDDAQINAHIDYTRRQTAVISSNTATSIKTTAIMKDLNAVTSGTSKVISSLGSASTKLIQGYTGGQTDIQMAGTAASAGLNLLKTAVSGVANGLEIAGNAISIFSIALGPVGKIVGTVLGSGLNLFGQALDAADKKVYELANAALPILTGELDKAFNSFNAINSSGAVFANGLEGMVTASKNVNLLLPEFAAVLRENSVQLSSSGLGIVQAAKQMGQVGIVMRTQGISERLKLLGITVKDQAELITDTMSNFAATNRLRGASEESLARFTDNYATSLKVLSGITGEDAKKAIEKNRRAAFQADVYAAISAKGPEALAKFQTQLELFNKQDPSGKLADAYSQTVSGITTVTDPATRFLMENQDVAKTLQTASQATLDNNIKMDDAVIQTTGAMGQMRESLLKNPEAFANIAAAARAGVGGIAADISTLVGNIFAATGLTKESAEAAKKNVDAAQIQTNNLTTSMLSAATAGRKFAEDLQDLIISKNILGHFADAISFSTTTINDAINEFIKNLPGGGGQSTTGSRQSITSGLPEQEVTRRLRELNRQNDARATNPFIQPTVPTTDANMPEFGTPEYYALTHPDDVGHARGGIVSGPVSGYMAKLHGEEAVIPLPDGVSGPEFAQALQGLARSSSIVGDTAAAASQMRDQLSNLSNDLLSSLSQKMDDLIYATQDVARYTKETSVRIM